MQIYKTSSDVAVLQKHKNYILQKPKKFNYANQRALKQKKIVYKIIMLYKTN